MKFPLYSIKDDLIGYGVPFAADNDAVAMRYFKQACSAPESIYAQNKSQFNLYAIGLFNNESGEIFSEQTRYVCSALDFEKE